MTIRGLRRTAWIFSPPPGDTSFCRKATRFRLVGFIPTVRGHRRRIIARIPRHKQPLKRIDIQRLAPLISRLQHLPLLFPLLLQLLGAFYILERLAEWIRRGATIHPILLLVLLLALIRRRRRRSRAVAITLIRRRTIKRVKTRIVASVVVVFVG